MKKVLLVAAFAAFVMTSCKKDYTCECCVSGSGTSICASTTIKDTKKNAKDACEKGSVTAGGITTACTIK